MLLDGAPLAAADDGNLPVLKGVRETAGEVVFPPASITFLTVLQTGNVACSVAAVPQAKKL